MYRKIKMINPTSKKPKVSIMMLAHNCEDYIEYAINSVLEQTFSDWELIIVDDYSEDNTYERIRKYLEDEKIKYFKNEKRKGIPNSRNIALNKADGEYLAVLDADDMWCVKEKLEEQVSFLDNNPDYGVIGSSILHINDKNEVYSHKKVRRSNFMIKILMPFTSQMLNSTAMTRTEMIRNNEGYVNRLSQDYDLWLSIGSISKMKNLDGFYAKYRVHDNNVSVTRRMEQIRSSIKSLKLHKKFTNIIFRQGGIYFRSIYICYLKYIKK
jgi:glycosyltransferase involved in cell wall biosynthesis